MNRVKVTDAPGYENYEAVRLMTYPAIDRRGELSVLRDDDGCVSVVPSACVTSLFTKTTSNYKYAKVGDGHPQVFTWDLTPAVPAEDVFDDTLSRTSQVQFPSADGGQLIAEFSSHYDMWTIYHD